jgi:hypothetical protein
MSRKWSESEVQTSDRTFPRAKHAKTLAALRAVWRMAFADSPGFRLRSINRLEYKHHLWVALLLDCRSAFLDRDYLSPWLPSSHLAQLHPGADEGYRLITPEKSSSVCIAQPSPDAQIGYLRSSPNPRSRRSISGCDDTPAQKDVVAPISRIMEGITVEVVLSLHDHSHCPGFA